MRPAQPYFFQAPALKLLFQKKSVLINSYIFMEKLSPQKFYSFLFFLIKELYFQGYCLVAKGA